MTEQVGHAQQAGRDRIAGLGRSGVSGFEPLTSCSQGRRASQTALHPVRFVLLLPAKRFQESRRLRPLQERRVADGQDLIEPIAIRSQDQQRRCGRTVGCPIQSSAARHAVDRAPSSPQRIFPFDCCTAPSRAWSRRWSSFVSVKADSGNSVTPTAKVPGFTDNGEDSQLAVAERRPHGLSLFGRSRGKLNLEAGTRRRERLPRRRSAQAMNAATTIAICSDPTTPRHRWVRGHSIAIVAASCQLARFRFPG